MEFEIQSFLNNNFEFEKYHITIGSSEKDYNINTFVINWFLHIKP